MGTEPRERSAATRLTRTRTGPTDKIGSRSGLGRPVLYKSEAAAGNFGPPPAGRSPREGGNERLTAEP